MKTIVKKNICIETKKHDFENQFAYIETWHNAQLKDCYFAEKEYLWPDGTIKSGGRKYFFCKDSEDLRKEIKTVNHCSFNSFDKLYFLGEDGKIINILST